MFEGLWYKYFVVTKYKEFQFDETTVKITYPFKV